jgi:hypothetical protein
MEARIGHDEYERLWIRHNQVKKYKDYELEELTKYYAAKL